MSFPFNKTLIPLLILITTWTGQSLSQELKIERKQRLVSYLQDGDEILKRWVKIGDDLYQAHFVIPTYGAGSAADPFADTNEITIKQNPKKYLEEIGVSFGKGNKVNYNQKNSILTVIQSSEQLKLIEAYFSMGCRRIPKRISIRTEIYQLPSSLAVKLIESCTGQSDHHSERDAVLRLVNEGEAKLVALTKIVSRSGQRSKLTDAYEVPFIQEIPQKKTADKKTPLPSFQISTRPVGTILEVDSVLGVDEWAIDLSLNLQHHTGPPEFISINDQIEIPQFHNKEITAQVTLSSGSYILIGSWKPTGKPEYENSELMHVVFLTANVQGLRDYGVLLPAEDPPTKK